MRTFDLVEKDVARIPLNSWFFMTSYMKDMENESSFTHSPMMTHLFTFKIGRPIDFQEQWFEERVD